MGARSRKFWKAANIFKGMDGNGCHKKRPGRAAKVPNLPPPDNWISIIITYGRKLPLSKSSYFKNLEICNALRYNWYMVSI
jgi:hypothetical protein